ncbi:MAG: 50S ribosomal protein L9 [Coriobacteriia bacterium]|nr:50S ribosomal protein L9 [Coriobacteriia bacterium]
MKVILLQELKGRGGEGDVIEVARGHAVNFLLPRKIAVEATKGNLKQLELRKHNIAKRESERLDSADKIFDALNEKTITVRARVGDEGQLFGSVTSTQIAEALREQFGAEIDRRKIDVHTPIKKVGEHVVAVSVYRDLKAELIVKVIDERTPVVVPAPVVEVVAEAEVEADTEAERIADEVIPADEAVPSDETVEVDGLQD